MEKTQSIALFPPEMVEIEMEDEKAVLMPKKLIDKSQAYFWTRKWQEGEREADERYQSWAG